MEGWARSLGKAPAYTCAPQPLSTTRERGKLQKCFHWNQKPKSLPPTGLPRPYTDLQTLLSCALRTSR